MVLEATSSGYRLEIHVIGDAAADAALDAMEYAKVAPEKRPILTHCQVCTSATRGLAHQSPARSGLYILLKPACVVCYVIKAFVH